MCKDALFLHLYKTIIFGLSLCSVWYAEQLIVLCCRCWNGSFAESRLQASLIEWAAHSLLHVSRYVVCSVRFD